MTTFMFNNKETYLAYRSNWKAEYNILSQSIRQTKSDIKYAQRKHEYAGNMQYDLYKQRNQATAMLEELKKAKQEAQQLYISSKKDVVVTA